jgi:hypothetical protein
LVYLDRDDIDILFSRWEPVPTPPGLEARVLYAVRRRAASRRRLGFVGLVASLIVAMALSFLIGQELQTSDALELLAGAVEDIELLSAEPSGVAMAFIELTPWPLAALLGLCLAIAAGASRFAMTPLAGLRARDIGQ